MSGAIGEEAMLIVMSIYGGLILILCYDAIRILRRVFPCSIVKVIIEDIIFWTVASIIMFDIYLKYNYGRPRFFSVVLTLGIMILFEVLIGRRFVDKIAGIVRKIINKVSKPLKKVWKFIKLKMDIKNKTKKGLKKCKIKKVKIRRRPKDLAKSEEDACRVEE